MRKTTQAVLSILLMAIGIGSAMAQPVVGLNSVVVAPGGTAQLDWSLTDPNSTVHGLEFDVTIPQELLDAGSTVTCAATVTVNLPPSCNQQGTTNVFRIAVTDTSANSIPAGVIGTLSVSLPDPLPAGVTSPIALPVTAAGGCFDLIGSAIACGTTDGEIVIGTPPVDCALDITTPAPLLFTMSPQTLQATLNNTGTGDCTGITPTITGAGYAQDAATTTCTATLTPTDPPCDIGITFSGTLGDPDGQLSVASNDPTSPDLLALTSTPIQECALDITVPTFTMSPETLQATLNNTGGADCTGITPTITGAGFALDAATTTCTATLTPTDAPCDIGITFNGMLGDTGQLSVASNDPNSPTVEPLNSTATPPIAIPTLSQWSMMIMGTLLAMLAMVGLRRQS